MRRTSDGGRRLALEQSALRIGHDPARHALIGRVPEPRRKGASARARAGGVFELQHIRGGRVIGVRRVHNLVVDVGIAALAGLVIGEHTDIFAYLALGDDQTAVTAADTALGNELTTGGAARALATLTLQTDTITDDSARLAKTFTFSSGMDINEVGAFDDDTIGVMLGRQIFATITVVNTDQLAVTYTFTFSPS